MLKRVILLAVTAMLVSAPASWARSENWEYQGKASTGESITLNLSSVQVALRSLGVEGPPAYFFSYQIGRDRIEAFTHCNGQFSTSTDGGDTFRNLVNPSSRATRKMLDRVCTYRVKTAQVFSPPSHVRTAPMGEILCTVPRRTRINTYGSYTERDWIYTDVCGTFGMIHSSQLR